MFITRKTPGYLIICIALTSCSASDKYAEACLEDGVPTPPDWGSPAWVYKGDLKQDFLDGLSTIPSVWAYESDEPNGLCIALPRAIRPGETNAGQIEILGIICQGSKNSTACFWDYPKAPTDQKIKPGESKSIGDFANGLTFRPDHPGGKCTLCHIGANPFLIHPDEVAFSLPKLSLPEWYFPLLGTKSGFPDNQSPETALDDILLDRNSAVVSGQLRSVNDKSCVTCHKLPQPTTNYVTTILAKATDRTMPPGTTHAAWRTISSATDLAYEKHVNALRDSAGLGPAQRDLSCSTWTEGGETLDELVQSGILDRDLGIVGIGSKGWGDTTTYLQNLSPSVDAKISGVIYKQRPNDSYNSFDNGFDPLQTGEAEEYEVSSVGGSVSSMRASSTSTGAAIGAVSRTEWNPRTEWNAPEGAAMYSSMRPSDQVVLPFVAINYMGMCSTITVQNATQETSVGFVRVYQPGHEDDIWNESFRLDGGRSITFRLCALDGCRSAIDSSDFPNGVLGIAKIFADKPLVVQSFVDDTTSEKAILGFEGLPLLEASNSLYAPLVRRGDDGHSSWIAVANTGLSPVVAKVTYHLSESDGQNCAEQALEDGNGLVTIAPMSQHLFSLASSSSGVSEGCRGAAVIEATGPIFATVIDKDAGRKEAAAYSALPITMADTRVGLPLVRDDQHFLIVGEGPYTNVTSVIYVMNVSDEVANVSVTGYRKLSADASVTTFADCSDCSYSIAPKQSHIFHPKMFKEHFVGSAIVQSNQPIAVVVAEQSSNGKQDYTMYTGEATNRLFASEVRVPYMERH